MPDPESLLLLIGAVYLLLGAEGLEKVAKNMSEQQVRRLPVVNRDKRLVGIISFGNIAQSEARSASKAAKGVTKPGGAHKQ